MKRLFPLHDAHGSFYPELDWRWVSGAVMVDYLACSRNALWKRTLAKEYGFGREQGVRHVKTHDKDRGRMEYRPGMIWRRLRLGRYGDERFDWRQLDGRIPLYCCPLGQTPKQVNAEPTAPDLSLPMQAAIADLARTASTAMALLGRGNAPLPIQFAAPQLAEVPR